jgi:hypothetical protein
MEGVWILRIIKSRKSGKMTCVPSGPIGSRREWWHFRDHYRENKQPTHSLSLSSFDLRLKSPFLGPLLLLHFFLLPLPTALVAMISARPSPASYWPGRGSNPYFIACSTCMSTPNTPTQFHVTAMICVFEIPNKC